MANEHTDGAEREERLQDAILAYLQAVEAGAAPDRPQWLARYPEFAAEDRASSGAIVCFVIAPSYRRQGLASQLLAGACDMLRERGLKWVYAYPPKAAATAAGSYHGKLAIYLDAGFTETGAGNKRYTVVRKAL